MSAVASVGQEILIFWKGLGITVLSHGVFISRVFYDLPVYAAVAALQKGDHQICLSDTVGDHRSLFSGECLRVGDYRCLVREEIHQALL